MELQQGSSTIKRTCLGCNHVITGREFLTCSKCTKIYDLECANVSEKRFRNTMTEEHRMKWVCQECLNKQPKTGNTNTPVRNIKGNEVYESCENITKRKQSKTSTVAVMKTGPAGHQPQPAASVPQHTETLSFDDKLLSAISDQVLKAIRLELPSMLSQIINRELATISSELKEVRKSMEFLSETHDEMRATIENLTKDNLEVKKDNIRLQTSIHELSDRLNNMEQHMRENNLELQGIPEHKNENLPNLLQQCSTVIGHQLHSGELISCVRVARQNKDGKYPRTVIAKFKSSMSRDEFLSAVHRYNKSNPNNKLNTSLLGLAGDRKPVYVSEHLSPTNKSLHAATRQKAKELGYMFVWVRNGFIYARKEQGSRYILIKNYESLKLIT